MLRIVNSAKQALKNGLTVFAKTESPFAQGDTFFGKDITMTLELLCYESLIAAGGHVRAFAPPDGSRRLCF